jgi:hypothetical protein
MEINIVGAATVINKNNVNMLFIRTIHIPSTSTRNYVFNDEDDAETILFYRGDELNILFPRHKNVTSFTIANISENSITTTTGEELYLEDIKGSILQLPNDYGGKRRTKRRTKRKNRKNRSRRK